MKKSIIILLSAAMMALAGCKQPEYPDFMNPESEAFTHEDVEISSMIMISVGKPLQSTLEGTIDNEAGTVIFKVPRADRDKYDLTKVKLQATVFYDAYITPKLGDRFWDVTSDDQGDPRVRITVTSGITGKTKEYTVKGYVSSK